MKPKPERRKILTVIGLYFGLRFFLAINVPIFAVASGSIHPALKVEDPVIVQGVSLHEDYT